MSVNGRLEFIEKEIKRFETQIKGIQEKSEKVKVEACQLGTIYENMKLTNDPDYPDTKRSTAATANGSIVTTSHIETNPKYYKIRYPFRFHQRVCVQFSYDSARAPGYLTRNQCWHSRGKPSPS
jgi:hypothetical protein